MCSSSQHILQPSCTGKCFVELLDSTLRTVSPGHIQSADGAQPSTFTHNQIFLTLGMGGKQVKNMEKLDQELMIHFQIRWELYQNICSKPTASLVQTYYETKSNLRFPSSHLCFPSLCDTLSGSSPILSFREKEFPLTD